MKTTLSKISEKQLRIIFSVLLIGITVYFQVQRLRNIPMTWDEGLTYVIHTRRFFYRHNYWGELTRYFTEWTEDAGNNHLLNTHLIALAELITQTRFNDVVIRLPVTCFLVGYTFLSTRMFIKGQISWIGYGMLMCCSYMNEFFALARGYTMSATLVLLAAYFFKKWQDEKKPYQIVLTFYVMLFAELANTATLLVVFSFAIVFFAEAIIEKDLIGLFKKLWLPMAVYFVLQVLLAIHHFHITAWDGLYAEYEHGVRRMMYDTLTLSAGNESRAAILFWAIMVIIAINAILFFVKIRNLKPYTFGIILFLYFVICFFAVNMSEGGGYPQGRVIIISYPLVGLAVDELVRNLGVISSNRIGTIFTKCVQAVGTVFIVFLLLVNTNCKVSTDWPEAIIYKNAVYDAYEKGIKTDRKYFEQFDPNTDAVRYWRDKIFYEDKFDVFGEASSEDTDVG